MPTPNYLILHFKNNRMRHQQVTELPSYAEFRANPDMVIYRYTPDGGYSYLTINPEQSPEWIPVPKELT